MINLSQTRLIHIDLLEQMKIAMRKGIVPIIKDSDNCNFGKWINDSGKKLYQQSPEFKLLGEHHDQFHNIAIELTKLLKKRDFDMAEIAMRELQHESKGLIFMISMLEYRSSKNTTF
jgi:hypothetical protein